MPFFCFSFFFVCELKNEERFFFFVVVDPLFSSFDTTLNFFLSPSELSPFYKTTLEPTQYVK